MKYYIVYKTTNQLNNNIYIGFHTTYDLNCEYLGSGTLLKQAIKKYGRENFKRDILFVFNTPQEAFEKEISSIKLHCPQYNINAGGAGWTRTGVKHTLETIEKIKKAGRERKVSEETKRKMSLSHKGFKHSEESKLKMSEAGKLHVGVLHSRYGKQLLEKHKRNMSLAHMGRKPSKETLLKMSIAQKLRQKRLRSI